MSIRIPTPLDLRDRGFRALVKELGYADALRFLAQYEPGRGDYVEERRTLLPDWSAAELTREAEALLRQARAAGETSPPTSTAEPVA